MLFTDVKSIAIPEGDVMYFQDSNRTVLWEKNTEPEYTQLQYITADGNQYIDTGYQAGNNPITIIVNASISALSNTDSYVCWSTNFSMRISYRNGRYSAMCKYREAMYGSTGSQVAIPRNQTQFVLQNGGFFIGNTRVASPGWGSFGTNDSIKIFDEGMSGNIYYVYIYDGNGEPVRYLEPRVRNSDNAVGLYDLENDVFYTSAGTYDFIAGPPVS